MGLNCRQNIRGEVVSGRIPRLTPGAITPSRKGGDLDIDVALESYFRNFMQVGLETPVTTPAAVSLPVDASMLKIPMLSEP
jgi:hypothetical protein